MKELKVFRLLFISFLILSVVACEDEIDLDLEEGRTQLVVDAFITNDSNIQVIRLTTTAPYFLNEATPTVSGASVKIIGPAAVEYIFQDGGNGDYTYDPSTQGRLDSTNFTYRLELSYNGEQYTAHSKLNPVPPIDSMTVAFEEEELGSEEGYYTQFWARDFVGTQDFYWIKAFKNGEPIRPDNPSSLILSEDAAFGGNGADGFVFILPLRAAITNSDEPFEIGDVSSVELLSLNEDVFEYLDQVTIQANNGGLFATPPSNIRTNIRDINGGLQDEVLGVFSLSSISRNAIQIQ
ncbi:MAG: hypothetical protein CMP59_02835 [Flavobacteriales bacterium]|nr:hypothetical protein [Flavobacteriales bacterium]|tara:strand:- start:657 stop:1538 length:882 start_codon:yes stop_codon:yes gene_type:complete